MLTKGNWNWLGWLCCGLCLWLLNSPIAVALPCRQLAEQRVCLVSLQRSAKNYWEYRAILRINDRELPLEMYNCRDRTKQQENGTVVRFDPLGIGNFVCQLYKAR